MAVSKRRISRRTPAPGERGKATPPDLDPVVVNGRRRLVPHRLVRAYQRRVLEPPPA
ncbi:MAG: 50S ribosomal protein L32 [Actinomycetota bacterium]|nr:50S ribosomal protein L32 [Actinomycetota bacterium]